jgi:hypothetical protein
MAGHHFTSNVLSERSESKDQPSLSFLAEAAEHTFINNGGDS